MANGFMRKSHARAERLRKLFKQVDEAGLQGEAFDPSIPPILLVLWEDEQRNDEEFQGSQAEEFFAALPAALDPAPWCPKKPERAARKRAQIHGLVMLALRGDEDMLCECGLPL